MTTQTPAKTSDDDEDDKRMGRRGSATSAHKRIRRRRSPTTSPILVMPARKPEGLLLVLVLVGAFWLATLSPRLARASDPSEDADLTTASFDYHANMPVITKRELGAAIERAEASVEAMRQAFESGAQVMAAPPLTSASLMALASSLMRGGALAPGDPLGDSLEASELANLTQQALVAEEATRQLARQHKLTRLQAQRGLPLISLEATRLGRACQRPARSFSCLANRYRSLSGHCNNVQNADWGAARTPLARYAPARYADNVAKPVAWRAGARPTSASTGALPSALAVSRALARAEPTSGGGGGNAGAQQHAHLTTMLSFFGQFVFHDLAHVAPYRSMLLDCCAPANRARRHPECMAAELAEGGACVDYVRSAPALRAGCNLGPRDQMNLVSSYLDGSVIYGSSEAQSARLRSFVGGRLRSQRRGSAGASGAPAAELLPRLTANTSLHYQAAWLACSEMARLRRGEPAAGAAPLCFEAGDARANENIGLQLMHTIWMREHNHIADRLAALNRHWRDERLFEEARRLVIAQLQAITYREFLPALLGHELMGQFNLSLLAHGYSQAYDPTLNAATANELAAAVLPVIRSTIPGALERYSERLEMLGATSLGATFMDGSELTAERNRFGQYLTGLMSQSAMEPSQALMAAPAMGAAQRARRQASNQEQHQEQHHLDLLAITIQQARDHGLRDYLYWRNMCQVKPLVRSWQDLKQAMPGPLVDRLAQVYAHPDQLDLYLGALETPLAGASLGPTFVCLLARQFFHTKHGDRFWFENDLPGSAFTPAQLEQVRQSSLAKVICRNSQASVSFVQPEPMLASDPYLNAYQYCTNRAMSSLDLSKWREPVTSAQQLDASGPGELARRAKRLAEAHSGLIVGSLARAKRQLDTLAHQETVRARRKRSRDASRPETRAGYRYLPRLRRQTLKLNNQSIIFQLATNELVRAMLHQGKDLEQAKSLQSDIRDFLMSLEAVQLDTLLANSAEQASLASFVAKAGGSFLTHEQRRGLAQLGDNSLTLDPLLEAIQPAAASAGAVSTNDIASCQDDERAFPCDHTSPFRTITGWCNNLQRPSFGQSFTQLDRLLPNAYEDGLDEPRQLSSSEAASSSNGATSERPSLPSARLVSTSMHEDTTHPHARYSLALMQFGQFGVDHDLTRTPFSVALDGSLLDCSACDAKQTVHRDCLPIEVPADDAHHHSAAAAAAAATATATAPTTATTTTTTTQASKCLHFVRSLNGQTGLGPRQQINALTAYLDASEIYGSDNCEAKSLRAFHGGRLNSSAYGPTQAAEFAHIRPREILPLTRANPECATPSGVCFHAGDQRASEQPGLTSIHTVFMRLHNSLVGQLAQLNRHWSDERLYQQGRRIVGAIMQRITYNEFAPRLLGLDYMSRFDLMLKQAGYSDAYDDSCSASILNEFAAAAFRMGHSLIRPAFPLLNKHYKPIGKAFQLRKAFFNSQRILTEPNLIDAILRGIVSTPIERLDNAITEELTNHLFERPREPFSGMDLIALNIQRARDHGLPGYNSYRAKCNLTRALTFEDLAGEIPAKLVKRLASLYAHVDDIDLFTGGISELPVHGGLVGPTLGCIIGLQFARLKRCDRFWHETGDPYVRFSVAQLAEIRKMTLAKVICQESDNIDTIQRNAMDISDQYLNPRVACSSLPSMDLSAWRENQKACLVNKAKLELGQSKRVNPCKSCTCTSEGPICRTVKIDCLKALKAQQLTNLMADKACLVQCAWALDMQQQQQQ